MSIESDKNAVLDRRRDRAQWFLLGVGFIAYIALNKVAQNPEFELITKIPGIIITSPFALLTFLILVVAIQRYYYYIDISKKAAKINQNLTRSLRKLSERSNYDSLTGFPNKRLLEDRFNVAVNRAKREKSLFLLCKVNLANFQSIVSKHGDQVGDKVIGITGKRIESALRDTDTIVRIEGCKFILIIESVDSPEDITAVTSKIRRKLGKHFAVNGNAIAAVEEVTMAKYPWDGVTLEALMIATETKIDRKNIPPDWIDAISDKFTEMSSSNFAFLRENAA